MPLLEVRDLRTWFDTPAGEARAVDGVSFEVEAGETVGLVGESGCGKTVTALSVTGLVDPPGRIVPGSSIRVGGQELVGASERRLRSVRGREVAMIFQEPSTSLNPVMTAGAQVAEPLRAHLGLGRRAARTRAAELLAEVGIPEPERRLDAYPHQLSGGLRQRVMIAMALAARPTLLIADEPTTALDVTIQARILALLEELRERRGMGMLLVTHDLGVVAETCDRVLVMYAGQIVESGGVEEVFRQPIHPYTRGLLALAPRLVGGDGAAAASRGGGPPPIPGAVPPATEWPRGCRFAGRCPHAWTRCRDEAPALLEVGAGAAPVGPQPGTVQAARCWLVEEPGRRGDGGTGA